MCGTSRTCWATQAAATIRIAPYTMDWSHMPDRFVVEPNTHATKKLFPWLVRDTRDGHTNAMLTDRYTADLLASTLNTQANLIHWLKP